MSTKVSPRWALEGAGAKRQDERVAMSALLERLDRRALVNDAAVVEQQAGPGLEHREAQARGAVGIEHAGLATLDALAPDQHHGDEVDAVAVRAFGRGPADAVGGVDAELVRFRVPELLASHRRSDRSHGAEDPRPDRVGDDGRLDRLEPALDAAMQRVVFERLPVRPMRRLLDGAAANDEA